MWMKCPHPNIPKLHSQANTVIGSLHFSIARGNCSDDGIWQGSSQCGEDSPPKRGHCQLCQPGRCTGCVRLIQNTIVCLVYFCKDHFMRMCTHIFGNSNHHSVTLHSCRQSILILASFPGLLTPAFVACSTTWERRILCHIL